MVLGCAASGFVIFGVAHIETRFIEQVGLVADQFQMSVGASLAWPVAVNQLRAPAQTLQRGALRITYAANAHPVGVSGTHAPTRSSVGNQRGTLSQGIQALLKWQAFFNLVSSN